MTREGYKNIAIPTKVFEVIEKYIQENEAFGYRTVTEFIMECVRKELKEMRRLGWIT